MNKYQCYSVYRNLELSFSRGCMFWYLYFKKETALRTIFYISFMWGIYPNSSRNVIGSTQVPVRPWNNARRGTWGIPPPVKLECGHITIAVLVRRKSKQKKIDKRKSTRSLTTYTFACLRYCLTGMSIVERIKEKVSQIHCLKPLPIFSQYYRSTLYII